MANQKRSVGWILDTDIGYDPDDLFALLLCLNDPRIKLDLIVTGDELRSGMRAQFVKTILDVCDKDILVVSGIDLGNEHFVVEDLVTERYDVDADFLDKIKDVVDKYDTVKYIGVQAMSNIAAYLEKFPQDKHKLDIYLMGGALNYIRRPGWIEHNIKLDIPAAKKVIASGADIKLVMAQTTFNERLKIDNKHPIYIHFKESNTALGKIVVRHLDAFNKLTSFWPFMHDPLTVSAAMGDTFVRFTKHEVKINEHGTLFEHDDGEAIYCSETESNADAFMKLLTNRILE